MTYLKTLPLLMLILAAGLIVSCSRGAPERERVAVVNGAPIYLDEFHREIAIASERDPVFSVNRGSLMATLDKMVEKRLLIQEARKRGITEDERFIEAIKSFWEQTLIQKLMEEQSKELAGSIYVTDTEVKRHYDRMGFRLTMKVKGAGDEQGALGAKKAFEAGEPVAGAETIGPVLLEDIPGASPLAAAFDLDPGGAGVFKDPARDGRGFIAVMVVGSERVPVRPLDEIAMHIRAELTERKKVEALSGWMDGVKGGASVEIDGKLLERIADE